MEILGFEICQHKIWGLFAMFFFLGIAAGSLIHVLFIHPNVRREAYRQCAIDTRSMKMIREDRP